MSPETRLYERRRTIDAVADPYKLFVWIALIDAHDTRAFRLLERNSRRRASKARVLDRYVRLHLGEFNRRLPVGPSLGDREWKLHVSDLSIVGEVDLRW